MPCCCAVSLLIRPRTALTAIVAVALSVSACGDSDRSATEEYASVVDEGAALYATHCAACHGGNLEGDPNWMTPNADGSYNPPPQNGTGHTWHHGDPTLVQLISQGSPFRESKMPAFGDVLTEEQIVSILEFFRSNWGEQERAFQQQATERDKAAGL